mgnify:CR=1 FL=1
MLSSSIKIGSKKAVLRKIRKYCPTIIDIMDKLLGDTQHSEICLELAKNVYLVGCYEIFDKLKKTIISSFGGNLDFLAYFTDILIEVGCIDLAYDILLILLRNRYNLPSVLINLAITSYLLGYPAKALKYVEIYENITNRESRLKVSLKIALGGRI